MENNEVFINCNFISNVTFTNNLVKATVYLGILVGFERTAFSLEFLGTFEAGNAGGFSQAARQMGGLTLQPSQENPAYTSIAHLLGVCTALSGSNECVSVGKTLNGNVRGSDDLSLLRKKSCLC